VRLAIVHHIAPWDSARKPSERALLYPTYGALLGAWIGVIPIGLDWDRPWQVIISFVLCADRKANSVALKAYPLTPAAGASLGYIIGALLALGVNLLLFFADADRLDSSGAANGPVKGGVKRKRKEGQIMKSSTKEE